MDTVLRGIKYDRPDGPLRAEMKKMGIRRKPPIPFLSRLNPINKYIGKILHPGKR